MIAGRFITSLASLSGLLVAGCDDGAYTLYRSSKGNPNMRIHVASYDASDGDAYNRENCEDATKLYVDQPGVTVRYWCEKGRFRK